MSNFYEFRIEQPSLVQALDKYREMEKVLEEEYDSLQDVIIQSSNEWQGAASEALISEMEYFLNEGDYNIAYENVKTMRMCMEDTLEQVNALLARSEEFPKQLQSSTYIEPMRPAIEDNMVRNGGVLYLDYGKANIVPDLCDQVCEAAEYLGNVLKQHMEACDGIVDGIPTYISRVDEAVRKIKRIENYKLSFQKYVQGVMALENDVAVRLAGMKCEPGVDENSSTIVKTREFETDYNRVTERGKEILRGELEAADYSSIEAQMIIYMIEKENPSYLSTLYALDSYGVSSSKDAVVDQIISYYKQNKDPEANLLDVVLENYQNDENIGDYDVYVGYLDYLKDEYYICPAEYEEILGKLKEGEPIPEEEIQKMEDFLEERNNLIETLKDEEISNGVNVPGWKKVEIVTALQIEIELLEAGYEEEFVYGMIGNIKAEGRKFGGLEAINETGYLYWEHIDDCIDYGEKYDPYDMTEVNLIELYFDRTTCSNDLHYWGIGVVQWTYDHRTMPLLEKYLDIAGYKITENGIETKEPPNIVITAENSDSVSVYLTYEQLCEVEIKHILDELQSEDYKDVEEIYLNNKVQDGFDYNIRKAAELIQYEYIENRDPSFTPVRQENAVRWCEARN